jgi:hypothetical protein
MQPDTFSPSIPDLSSFRFSLPEVDASGFDTQLGAAVSPTIVWLAILIVGVFAIIMTFILRWHWKKYALNTRTEKKMNRIYLATLAILFAILIGAAIHYQALHTSL